MNHAGLPALAAMLVVCTAPAVCAHNVHAVLDEDGRLQVSAHPTPGSRPFDPHGRRRAGGILRADVRAQDAQPPASMHALIKRAAAEAGIEAALVHAVAWNESRYDPLAVSRAGAAGVMQLMPGTAQRFGVHDRFDAAQSLRGGARYLAWLLEHYGHDVPLALAAYNAGEGNVARHGNRIPPFPETQQYVRRVLQTYARAEWPGGI